VMDHSELQRRYVVECVLVVYQQRHDGCDVDVCVDALLDNVSCDEHDEVFVGAGSP
jgi:hypothetical protein